MQLKDGISWLSLLQLSSTQLSNVNIATLSYQQEENKVKLPILSVCFLYFVFNEVSAFHNKQLLRF